MQFTTSDETDCKITDIQLYDSKEATEPFKEVKIDAFTLISNEENQNIHQYFISVKNDDWAG